MSAEVLGLGRGGDYNHASEGFPLPALALTLTATNQSSQDQIQTYVLNIIFSIMHLTTSPHQRQRQENLNPKEK